MKYVYKDQFLEVDGDSAVCPELGEAEKHQMFCGTHCPKFEFVKKNSAYFFNGEECTAEEAHLVKLHCSNSLIPVSYRDKGKS